MDFEIQYTKFGQCLFTVINLVINTKSHESITEKTRHKQKGAKNKSISNEEREFLRKNGILNKEAGLSLNFSITSCHAAVLRRYQS